MSVNKGSFRLDDRRRALLDALLEKAGVDKATSERIPRRNSTRAPLSFAQYQLWFFDQLVPDNAAFNLPFCVRLSGALDVAALEQSFREIIRRHESLRTSFTTIDGQPVQEISPAVNFSLLAVDLSDLIPTEREEGARRIAAEAIQQPFDLTTTSLLRASVLRLSADDHVLLLTMHHIVSDGWSIGIFIRELSDCYNSFIAGREPELSELPIQYSDYATWQREWLQGDELEDQLQYWREQLAGVPEVIELPTDRPRPAVQTHQGHGTSLFISRELSEQFKALSQAEGATLFMSLLAAFSALLHSYSGQDDIVVGTPTAGRNRTEVEDVIGLFLNTLVLRTSVSGDPTFKELLGRVKEVALGAYAHQELPLEKIIEEIQPARSLSYNPLFQVLFQLQNLASESLELTGLQQSRFGLNQEGSKVDLTLSIKDSSRGLGLTLIGNSDLFDSDTLDRMVGHFEQLLRSIVSNPDQRLSELRLLTAAEENQLLREFNQTSAEYPRAKCIHELFEEQARLRPDTEAVIFGDQRLPYRELNERANQLAHYLREQGVGPEITVGLCVERSLEMIVGLLAVLKAGGAYVPLDPQYPTARLSFMLEESGAAVLLTQDRLRELLPASGARVLSLDSEWNLVADHSRSNPHREATPNNPAYVIYTSGSTGQPKGVMTRHQSLCAYTSAAIAAYGITADDRVLQFASINFDTSAEEIYPTLAQGATLILRPEDMLNSMRVFLHTCAAMSISVLDLPTAFWHELVRAMEADAMTLPASVRVVILGGEKASIDVFRRWQRIVGPTVELFNSYGPTEATIVATIWKADDGLLHEVPIGTPVANAQLFVLNQHLQPVPLGVKGELYIAGAGLARGYLNSPTITAEKFLPNPFSAEPGARFYRTGDLVRRLANGNLEFAGRVDEQVKIRGFRVETGEIETALSQHPGIQDNVVVAEDEPSGSKRLVAYVVAKHVLDTRELRASLKTTLPEYMIPASFVLLDELPRLPNGKLDRGALPKAGFDFGGDDSIPPRTAVEEVLAGIWCDLLRVKSVGVQDNFFELGGHSLLATQVLSRIAKVFDVSVPLRRIFTTPTISGLAEYVEAELGAGRQEQTPALLPASREAELPLSFAQQRLWFFDQLEPESSAYNIHIGIKLEGALDLPALERSLEKIIARHEALRTVFITSAEGKPTQSISPARVSLSVTELLTEAEVRVLAAREERAPFDLANGPLLRASLLRLAAEDHVLLLTMHHIISDGWSMGIFVRELSACYNAFAAGVEPQLPELPIQYGDYAVWQREWLQGEVLEAQLQYWREQLAGAPQVLELPTDRPRPPVQSHRGALKQFQLKPELTRKLKELSRHEDVTLFMLLLAAWQVLLARYSGQNDVVVGTPIANRTRAELEGLIGFFVNTLALRVEVRGGESFRELLKRVRESCLGAYGHQDVPFEKLVEELQPERSLSYSPVFQVMFSLQNAPPSELVLSNLKFRLTKPEVENSKVDLTLTLFESAHGLTGSLIGDTDLFNESTLDRIAGLFEQLVYSIVNNPEQRVAELRLLSGTEEERLLRDYNETATDYPRQKCVHELFEEQARLRPEAIAVVFGEQRLSYGELNERANQLAHYLRAQGVGPESMIGLCVERTVEMVIGLLGVLKAGGAYVPLDVQYPASRLRYMLAESGARVLLTQERLRELLPESGAHVLSLDSEWATVALESRENVASGVRAENLAYVIYTSGSTGEPKGVAVPHGAIVRLVKETDYVQLESADRVAQVSNISFDAATFEVWGALGNGAQLVLIAKEEALDVERLIRQLREHEVSTMFVTTAWFNQLAQQQQGAFAGVKHLLFGGEAVDVKRVREVVEGNGPERLLHVYGPTESTTFATWHEVRSVGADAVTVAIGRGIANTRAYVLDAAQRVVPEGVRGELCLGGDGLARGYLGRPEITAEKFVPDPFSTVGGERLYRTGDVVRWVDGALEFVGRVDEQVKVRGFRIELGEIEVALKEHECISDCVVVAQEDETGKRLVAYVVWSGAELSSSELRQYLKERLPEYMVPAVFVSLEQLPLTVNGKVDRKALPAAELSAVREEYVGPRNAVEEELCRIWSAVLKVERVGIEDNFFELGGDSILSIQIIARAAQAGLQLTPRQLFEQQTIRALAEVVGSREGVQAEQGLVSGSVALTPIQHYFFEQELVERDHYNQALLLELPPETDVELVREVVKRLVLRHDALRLRFEQQQGEWRQSYAGAEAAEQDYFEVVDLSGVAERSRELTRRCSELQQRLNISTGPLLRVGYFELGAGERKRLLLAIHHLAIDGVSWRILVEELQAGYAALARGVEPEWGAKTSSYQQWAAALVEYVGRIEEQAPYWEGVWDGATGRVPREFEGANTIHSEASVRVSLSTEETRALLQEVAGVYHTQINDVLLTALGRVLGEWVGSERVIVGLEGHGREQEEIGGVDVTQTVGWFTTLYPAVVEVRRGSEVGEALRSVKEQLREIPGKGVGYGALRYLGSTEVRERLRQREQMEVSFNYLGQFNLANDQQRANRGWTEACEAVGADQHPDSPREHLLEINGSVMRGSLQFDWNYSANVHTAATIERIANNFVAVLREVISHCLSPDAGGFTLSDFPDAELDQSELDELIEEFGEVLESK
jgi:amino acid adenylation domain-containing protein/non-ribosomal peptide synthase protein (TIGR01720 family)